MAEKRRVWIIGAGFPRSLGAPLLDELLSPITELQIAARYPKLPVGAQGWVSHIIGFYAYGTRFQDGRSMAIHAQSQGRKHWRHAEHFLEYLDDIDRGSPGEEVLEKLWNRAWQESLHGVGYTPPFPGAEELAQQARRVIAAAVSAFIPDDFIRRERTKPYLAWAEHLGANDTVLSFNYDRVLESLKWTRMNEDGSSTSFGFHVVDPSMDSDSMEEDRDASAAKLPTLLKLHGSVDWCHGERRIEGAIADVIDVMDWNPSQLLDERHYFAIATPGKMKIGLTEDFFSKLWRDAAESIEEADEIYIIGCRLAEGDAKARDTILDAIKRQPPGKDGENPCTMHVVLGTDTSGGDVRRLESLLDGVVQRNALLESGGWNPIVTHPLWAEDFLSKWARSQS